MRAPRREYIRAAVQRLREARRAEGHCVACGDDSPEYARCWRCRMVESARYARAVTS